MTRSDLPERRLTAVLDSIGEAAAQNALLRVPDAVLAVGLHYMSDTTRDRVLRLTGSAKAARVRDAIDRHRRMKIGYEQYAHACDRIASALDVSGPRPADGHDGPGPGPRRPNTGSAGRPAAYYRPSRRGSDRDP